MTEAVTTLYGIWRKDVNQNRGDWLREFDDIPTAGIIVFTSIRKAQRRAYEMYGFNSYREVTRKDWAEVRPLASPLDPRAEFIAALKLFLDDYPGGLIGKKQLRERRPETEHSAGVVVCGDCLMPLRDPGYHLWGARDANGRREKVCLDEPIIRDAWDKSPEWTKGMR